MDRRRRFVQQYVERQKVYLPTYTTEHERHGTPAKPLRTDEFGFDTPVLRPRVPVNKPSQSQPAHEAENPPLAPPSETQDPALSKPRPKRKKTSTQIDTDSERAARLADRRERKRQKRAIVNPPHDDIAPAAAPKKGRTNGQKAKKPAALALLYGFSATNVTKDRLTLKPAPSLGVFSKGRASAKKKVTATRKSSSKHEIFSESAFLNKPSAQAADRSKIDDDSDDSSVSSISSRPAPQASRITNRTKKDRGKCTEMPQASTRTTAESELWDIELQSKLPSSARDASSEPGENDSGPVVLDLRKVEWSASLEEHEERHNKTRTRSSSVTRSGTGLVRNSPPARLDELGLLHAADAPSIHPSHSASQVGRRAADIRPSDPGQVTSKYFTEPVLVREFVAYSLPTSRSNDGLDVLDSRIPDQGVQDAALDVQTILRVASPIDSLISVAQPMVEFQTRYDMVPLEFPSDCSPYDDFYARVDVALEPLGGRDHGCFETCVVGRSMGALECHNPHQGSGWDLYGASAGLAGDDVEYVSMEGFEGGYDYGDDLPVSVVEAAEYDPEEGQRELDFAVYEDDGVDGWDGESGEDVAEFLEGRALLLGVPEGRRCVRLSGLAQAEMDVASRLRDHWRPLRLS